MGGAAGADVHAGDRDDAHLALDLDFAAVGEIGQLLPGRIGNLHRKIGEYGLVGRSLDPGQFLPADGAVEIQGHVLIPQVEAHIAITEPGVHQAGDDVLAGMLLHA